MTARERLLDSGVVAVLRNVDSEALVPTVEALRAGGVTAVEVTVDAPRSDALIAAAADALADDPDAIVGAGSVLDASAARSAIDAGAAFVVSPTLEPAVIEVAHRYNTPVAPGVMTPTEALRAAEAGADLIKIFPAATVGPGHLDAIQAPLGELPLFPTGGIDTDNVADFFAAGARVVGAGSALVDHAAIERGDFDAVEKRAARFVTAVDRAQK